MSKNTFWKINGKQSEKVIKKKKQFEKKRSILGI